MCWILISPMTVVIGMSRQYSHFIISELNASGVSSIISLLYVFTFNECPFFTQFFTPVPKISFFANKQFILNFFFLELGKLLYARVSKVWFPWRHVCKSYRGMWCQREGHLDKFNRRRKYMWALLFSEFFKGNQSLQRRKLTTLRN